MNVELIKEQFFEFLKEHKCKDEYFINNSKQLGCLHWVRSFNYLLHNDPECLIQDAFKWSETDEENDFWSNLNIGWYRIYHNYLSNNKAYYKSDEIWLD